MKTLKFFTAIFSLFFFSICAYGQTTQSTMYDAIGILNAENGVNAIFIPIKGNYAIRDPLTGNAIKSVRPFYTNGSGKLQISDLNLADSGKAVNVIYAILARNAGLPTDTTKQAIYNAYQNNPFLKSIFKDASGTIVVTPDLSAPITPSGALTPANDGGINTTTIADNLVNGVADFLIKRAGEEISVSVFANLQKFIGNYPEFAVLFPETVKLIKPVTPYDYANTVKALRDALQNDLANFTANLPLLYNIPKYKQFNDKVPALTLIFTASALLHELNGQSDLGKTLHDLDTSSFLGAQNNYASFIRLICISSDSFRKKLLSDPENQNYAYFTLSDIAAFTNNDLGRQASLAKYYLGLFYQQTNKITFWSSTGAESVNDLMNKWAADNKFNAVTVLNLLLNSGSQLETLRQQLDAIKTTDQTSGQFSGQNVFSSQRFDLYSKLIASSLNLLSPFVKYGGKNAFWTQDFPVIINYWPTISTEGIATVKAFSLKDYTLGISDFSSLMGSVSQFVSNIQNDTTAALNFQNLYKSSLSDSISKNSSKITALNTQIAALGQSAAQSQIVAAVASQKTILQSEIDQLTEQNNRLTWQSSNAKKVLFEFPKILQYLNLLAGLSQTNNSQEVETLLETYALPSGSYQVKKETTLTLGLNSYVGGYYAPSNNAGSGFTNQYGLTAPIGLSLSHGFDGKSSISLFLGVVDIGGVIRYKLNNNGAYQQDVSLAGIVAPSVQLVWGLPINFPLAIGGGWQWTSPTTTASNNINLSAHFNLFLAIDIPLFNFVTVK